MDFLLQLAGIVIAIHSERDLVIDPAYDPFLLQSPAKPDTEVSISWVWDDSILPTTQLLGEDALQQFYQDGDCRYCVTKGGVNGPVACAQYDDEFRKIRCTINEKPFLLPTRSFHSIIRMLPIRALLLHFDVLFFHASQISFQGNGILFSAPSGTGKTTQAKLWQKYRGADLVSNDRVMVRCLQGAWQTFSFPLDGSEPIIGSYVNQLAAIILLKQGLKNEISQPNPSQILSFLMGQMVMDCWSDSAKVKHILHLMSLIEEIPVLQLTCTADETAVTVLEQALTERKVLANG